MSFRYSSQKCNKLLKLESIIDNLVPISDRFFDSFSEFKSIKKLKITILKHTNVKSNIKSFKHCKQLIELDMNYRELREDFFANIALFVPKLQSLRIHTKKLFSDTFINSFHSMKSIRKVELFNFKHTI